MSALLPRIFIPRANIAPVRSRRDTETANTTITGAVRQYEYDVV